MLVGEELAAKTEPLSLNEGVLEVGIPESWEGQTKKIAKRIRQDVSAFFPSVKSVSCVAGANPKQPILTDAEGALDSREEPSGDDSLEATLQRIEALMLKRDLQNK